MEKVEKNNEVVLPKDYVPFLIDEDDLTLLGSDIEFLAERINALWSGF
mgnify:FL=1